jgi:outer membrane receptor protein involved in Fe transport
MRIRAPLFLLGIALILLMAIPAQAQFARASLAGTVRDPGGLVLPGVTVTATNEGTGIARTVVTSESGHYIFNGLTPATYTVEATLNSFKTFRREGLILNVGQEVTLDINRELGGIEETVTVTAESPMVELTSKEVGAAVTEDDFSQLPTQNRSFVMFASLAPGVVPSPDTQSTASDSLFINGQDDNNNSFNVDGANNDDDVIGARAGAQTRTAIEAIQEFQILTSQYDAEFGRTQGGVLNAVTKSGTNEFHGVGFVYYQDASINSKNFFTERAGADQPDFNVMSLGGVVGGPIVRDRAHFFVSVERITPNEGIVRTFDTRPDQNFSTTEDNLLRNLLFKVDWQIVDKHRFAARYLQEYSPQFNQIIGSTTTLEASREEDDTDTSFITSLDSVFSDTAFNNLRVSFTQEDVAFANPGFNNGGQSFEVQRALDVSEDRPSVLEGASNTASARVNESWQVDDTFSLYVPGKGGDHNIRFGFNYSHRTVAFNNSSTANGQFDYDTDIPWQREVFNTYPQFFNIRIGGPGGNVDIPGNNVLGIFLQDDWQPRENLTVNLGLRYDYESITNDKNNFGPRVGITWDPIGEGHTVVRGGWGRFYERMQLGDNRGYSSFFTDALILNGGFTSRFPDSGDDPQLFWDTVHNNNIQTLNGLRDFIAAQREQGALSFINGNPTVDDPNRRQSYSDTFSVGVKHEIAQGLAAGVDYIRTHNRDIRVAVDLNPTSRSQGGRPNISIANGQQISIASISSTLNGGTSNYSGLQFSLQRRFMDSPIGRYSARVSYTWSNQSGNADAGREFPRFQTRTESGFNFDTDEWIGAPLDVNLNHPQNVDRPSPWHRDHNIVGSWSWLIPGTSWNASQGLYFAGIWRYMQGNRFEIQSRSRLDNNNRVLMPEGTYSADPDSDIGLTVDFGGRENTAELPDFMRLDFSFRYAIPIAERYEITVLGDIFNVTNRVNFSNAGSTYVEDSNFLIPNSAFPAREFQFGVRFTF